MATEEQRGTERLMVSIPIRVVGFNTMSGDFTEDTQTIVVNQAGARISLHHRVEADDVLRIANLENYNEADFRVVGPTRMLEGEVGEWGVECSEVGRNIWGFELPAPLEATGAEAGALLECRACHAQGFWPLTLMEVEVLNSTGIVNRQCSACKKVTYWAYADIERRPREFAPGEPVAPAPREAEIRKKMEKRREKRMGMKLPVWVRNARGEEETAKTENVSKGGFAVSLAMDLNVGDELSVMCPYTPGSQDIPQKADVRRRATFPFGGRRLYGVHYIR
jgi:PilZ domain